MLVYSRWRQHCSYLNVFSALSLYEQYANNMSAAHAEQLTFQNFRCSAKHQEVDVPTFLCLSEEISLTVLEQLLKVRGRERSGAFLLHASDDSSEKLEKNDCIISRGVTPNGVFSC